MTSFEAHFTLRLAVRIDMLFFRRFCLQSLVFAYCLGECCFLPNHSLASEIFFLSKIHSSTGAGNVLLIVCQFKISNYSVCQQHTYICASQGQSTFCVHCNKSDLQNVELLCAIGNCFACQVRHACRRLPTPAPIFTSPS